MESQKQTNVAVYPARKWRSTHKTCFLGGCLMLLAFLIASSAYSQTIAGYKYPNGAQQQLSAGDTVYIDPQDATNSPMPKLTFYISDISSYSTCTHVQWTITVSYTDPDGFGTSYSGSATTSPGSSDWAVQWTDDAGGTATVTAILYDCSGQQVGNSASFTFYIWGRQQSQDQVHANEGGMPWFTGSMISVESCYGDDQFAPSTGFCNDPSNVAGQPLWGSPDGIGLMQPDRSRNPEVFTNCTYWNFICNMKSANQVLSEKENDGSDPAYPFWDRQMYQMCRYLQTYVNGSITYSTGSGAGNSTCSAVQQPGQGAPPGGPTDLPSGDLYAEQSLPYCTANFTLAGNQASGWKDAEAIKAYNGATAYYINWDQDTNNASYQYWYFSPGPNNYVYNVCNTAPY